MSFGVVLFLFDYKEIFADKKIDKEYLKPRSYGGRVIKKYTCGAIATGTGGGAHSGIQRAKDGRAYLSVTPTPGKGKAIVLRIEDNKIGKGKYANFLYTGDEKVGDDYCYLGEAQNSEQVSYCCKEIRNDSTNDIHNECVSPSDNPKEWVDFKGSFNTKKTGFINGKGKCDKVTPLQTK